MLEHLRNIVLLLCTQRSSRHKNCKIGGLNVLKIQLQTVFHPGYSQRNITSVQALILRKKKLLVDKCDNHVLYRATSQIWQLLQHGMGS